MNTPLTGAPSLITEKARKHADILAERESLDYAPTALQSNEDAISSLEGSITELNAKVTELRKKTEREYKDVTKLQNSASKRLLVRLKNGGKKDAVSIRLEKEQKEFTEALEAQQQEEEGMNALKGELELLREKNVELKKKVERCNQLRAELDALYKSVFDGYTPHYPQEDEEEETLRRAESEYTLAQSVVNKESEALSVLSKAQSCIIRCQQNLQTALGWNFNDMLGGGFLSEMMENNALIDAKGLACRAEALVASARKIQPLIAPIRKMDIAQLDIVTNVLFNNVFTDLMLSDKIRESMRMVQEESDQIRFAIAAGQARAQDANRRLTASNERLQESRKRLEDIRRTILVSISQGTPLPPPYTPPAPGVVLAAAEPEPPTEPLPPYMPRDPTVARARAEALLAMYGSGPSSRLSPTFSPRGGPGLSVLPQRDGALTPRLGGLYDRNPYAASLLERMREEELFARIHELARDPRLASRRSPSPRREMVW